MTRTSSSAGPLAGGSGPASRAAAEAGGATVYSTSTVSLVNSGNRTLGAPKRSWKADLEPEGDGERLAGMSKLNLKSMFNDPSQLRDPRAAGLQRRRRRPLRHRHPPAVGGAHPQCPGVPALGRREPAHRQLGQLLRHALQLLPLQLRAARRRPRLCRLARLHLHPLGLRQQLRHRLLRHPWQDTDLVDWASTTANYGRRHSGGALSRIPPVQHLLRNRDFLRCYRVGAVGPVDSRQHPSRTWATLPEGAPTTAGRVRARLSPAYPRAGGRRDERR
jgi:hypothetical protein